MFVAIIDYGSGNLRSVVKAFQSQAKNKKEKVEVVVTSESNKIYKADRIVLPGVGSFADCRSGLFAVDGMVEAIEEAVLKLGRPFLGICVGLQLLAEHGLEDGIHPGLGWVAGEISRINPVQSDLKIPHMGWNTLNFEQLEHPLLDGLRNGDYAYFVHSYAFRLKDNINRLATVKYGAEEITAAIAHNNIFGTQFHPEKSQTTGLKVIENFLNWSI